MTRRLQQRGFTLIEAIVAIVITGIVAGMVAIFITRPVQGYFDTVRRAVLTDEADTSLRFIARELHTALPNSITCPTPQTLSFIPVVSGGRYREGPRQAGTGTPLNFGDNIATFDTVGGGGIATLQDAHGRAVSAGTAFVGNLGTNVSACDATLAVPTNTLAVATLSGTAVVFTPTNVPSACNLQSSTASNVNDRTFGRFYMTDATVTYTCDANGLNRNGRLLSKRVTAACAFTCQNASATVQTITVSLTLQQDGESLTLIRQVHVENYP